MIASTSSTVARVIALQARVCSASLALIATYGMGQTASFRSCAVSGGRTRITSFGNDLRTHPKAYKNLLIPASSIMSPKCLTASKCASVDFKPFRLTMSPKNCNED